LIFLYSKIRNLSFNIEEQGKLQIVPIAFTTADGSISLHPLLEFGRV
jgi:hypothetical protein